MITSENLESDIVVNPNPFVIREEIPNQMTKRNCIVVVESWPIWLLPVIAADFDVEAIVSGSHKEIQKYFNNVSNKIWKSSTWITKLRNRNVDIVFISGSTTFVEIKLIYLDEKILQC